MFAKFKRKSDRAKNALRSMFRSPSPEPPAIALEYTSWEGLGMLIRWLDDSPDGFDGLKPVIDRISTCVKIFDVQARTRHEYSQLGIDMDELFSRFADESGSPWLSPYGSRERIAPFAQSLDCEIKPLVDYAESNVNAEEDMATNELDQVLRHYRRIRTLFAVFLMCESPAVWKSESGEELFDALPHVPQASYLCAGPDAVSRNGCMPHTREDVLKDLYEWVRYGKSQNIRWLNGTTGAGKTAVAYSLCDHLESRGTPFASFFGSRQIPSCRDVKRVWPSISYQLSQQSLPFRRAVSRELTQRLDVLHLPAAEQFEQLIAAPLGKVGHTFSSDPVIVIDGIEECDDKDEIYRLLRILVERAPTLPLKLLVSILPSRMTHKYMRGTPGERHQFELRLHELDSTVARADVRTYLAAKLEHLTLSTTELERLAQQSGASFVYATALVRCLAEANPSGQPDRLLWLLEAPDPLESNTGDPQVLYSHLTGMLLRDKHLEESQRGELIRLLHAASHPEAPPTLNTTASLLKIDFASHESNVFRLLLPVVFTSDLGGSMLSLTKPFARHLQTHAPFSQLYQDLGQVCTQLAHGCFDLILSVRPSFNICDLESSYLWDQEVPYLRERVDDSITPELLYACRRWAEHMTVEGPPGNFASDLEGFLSTRLLLWMEILNLKRSVRQGVEMLTSAQAWAQREMHSDSLQDAVKGARLFAESFSSKMISSSTPHIYLSQLQFWPQDRVIYKYYGHRLKNLVNQSHADGHTNDVNSVCYSSDGAYIASGSYDKTIRIWDARTSKPVGQPLTDHTSDVYSVAYSPDGAYIASGSQDNTIRVWDAHTGKPVGQPLTGHPGPVWSVAYSPDGAYIASGTVDKTIRIWDARTGEPVGQPLTGHTDRVYSVAYSPDGAYIASGSYDKTIRIWDARTGKPVGQPLTGHTSSAWSVAYSPDGTYIASGSWDSTIRIWDARSGKPLHTPLMAYTLRLAHGTTPSGSGMHAPASL
ncbi:hypothetical protein FRC12_012133 [Ceratobasidium sp. 428]|nr:hypothetical protein FRC12_012133 [Ceratobasidium sp. 428]